MANEVSTFVKTLDCYVSVKQDLQDMYSRKFGFKTASLMDWNPAYDHDGIGANHGSPQVAFMVNTDKEVATKRFEKGEYDEAVVYRNPFLAKTGGLTLTVR